MATYAVCDGTFSISPQNGVATCSTQAVAHYIPPSGLSKEDAASLQQGLFTGVTMILVFWLIKKAIDI